ncbi:hypothetical protein [Pseudomonas aeruginosa]|uniref:hypothetical protein n=1 Tax=Pseudomonas aeruginosa TaxID=287 RepID=UPI000F821C98|nr:hypothetical protein [Pseudomonas aeruginosa]RTV58137.1 hypothetical protein DY991_22070 [Pseudomonas aeruginosa]
MKKNVKRYLLKAEQEIIDEALEIAKANDFSLAGLLNGCIEQYVKNYKEQGFQSKVYLDIEIKKFKRINNQ